MEHNEQLQGALDYKEQTTQCRWIETPLCKTRKKPVSKLNYEGYSEQVHEAL